MALVHKSGILSNIYFRFTKFEEIGDQTNGWVSLFDRIVILSSGSVTMSVDGTDTNYVAPEVLRFKANTSYILTSTSENTSIMNVYGIRNGNNAEDIIDPSTTQEEIDQLILDYPFSNRPLDPPPNPE